MRWIYRHPLIYEIVDFLDSGGLSWLARGKALKSVKGRVLEVGIGTGLSKRWLKGCSLFGVDLSKTMLERAKRRGARVCVADAVSLPFKDGAFEVVLFLFSLRVMSDGRKALKEALRVGRRVLILEYLPLPRPLERLGFFVYGSKPLGRGIFDGLKVDSKRVAGIFVLHEVKAPQQEGSKNALH